MSLAFILSPQIILLASSASAAIFGFVPARKAAHLNPIDALRHE